MSLSRYEQETVINFNREDDYAEIYTADSVWMNKMDKLIQKNGTDFELIETLKCNGKVVSKTYKFPKRFISIRSKDRSVSFTAEQIAEYTKRLPHAVGTGTNNNKTEED